MRIYLPKKVIFTKAARPRGRGEILLRVDKTSSTEIEVNNCFVI